jgi:hypothetical protein
MMSEKNIHLYFQAKDIEHNTCVINDCGKKAIKAHSVQNSQVLELLCYQGHLIQLALTHNKKSEPTFQFEKVGRNNATTFKGLCSRHDTEIFKPIECNTIDYDIDEHLFLISYRSILWEYHAKISAAQKYSFIANKIKNNHTENLPNFSELEAQHLAFVIEAWRENNHKLKYDFIYEYKAYEYIKSKFFLISTTQPTIAASAVINTGRNEQNDFSRATLNVLPLNNNKTLALISWLNDDNLNVVKYFDKIFNYNNSNIDVVISKILIQQTENVVISPNFFDTWSEQKKSKIIACFSKNLGENKIDIEDTDINLF